MIDYGNPKISCDFREEKVSETLCQNVKSIGAYGESGEGWQCLRELNRKCVFELAFKKTLSRKDVVKVTFAGNLN